MQGNEFVKSLIKDPNWHREGFPHSIWVLMKGVTDVSHDEEANFRKAMYDSMVRKRDLEWQLLQEATGYHVVGLRNSFVVNMSKK